MSDGLTDARLAIVGLAKHSGKTTALNRLVQEADEAGESVGVCSIGLDGENVDTIHDLDKPRVHAGSGQLVVSARHALEASTCDIKYLRDLGVPTPLGRLCLGRCLSDGELILAGVATRASLDAAVRSLIAEAATSVFVDGAFGRSMAVGAADIRDILLAVGAVSGNTCREIAEAAEPVIDQLSLPGVGLTHRDDSDASDADAWRADLLTRALGAGQTLVGGPDIEASRLSADSALVGLRQTDDLWKRGGAALAIPGAVTDSVVEELMATRRSVSSDRRPWLLVRSASSFKLAPDRWRALRSAWRIAVARPVRLRAIAINPRRPDGTTVEPARLRRSLKQAMIDDSQPRVPIWDPRTADEMSLADIGNGPGLNDNAFGGMANN